jgi:hypothetical protein
MTAHPDRTLRICRLGHGKYGEDLDIRSEQTKAKAKHVSPLSCRGKNPLGLSSLKHSALTWFNQSDTVLDGDDRAALWRSIREVSR